MDPMKYVNNKRVVLMKVWLKLMFGFDWIEKGNFS